MTGGIIGAWPVPLRPRRGTSKDGQWHWTGEFSASTSGEHSPSRYMRDRISDRMALVTRLLRQTPKTPRKLYALHEPVRVNVVVALVS